MDANKIRRYLGAVAEDVFAIQGDAQDGVLRGYHASGTPCYASKRTCPLGGCVGHHGESDFDERIVRLVRRKIANPPQVKKNMLNDQTSISDILDLGIRVCELLPGAHKNNTGAVYVKNKDVGEFVVGKKGLRHGLRPYNAKTLGDIAIPQKYNAYVMTVLGEVINNAFLLRTDKKGISGREYDSDVLMSACSDDDSLIPVLIRINRTEGTISKVVVLKSINTKRQDLANVIDSGFEAPDDPALSRHHVVCTEDAVIITQLASMCQ